MGANALGVIACIEALGLDVEKQLHISLLAQLLKAVAHAYQDITDIAQSLLLMTATTPAQLQ